ncbi:MAG: hypothetical protein Hyperionvirus45_4 [Hyperionvirus sp.]|uniref:Uncharacterized protein n=1 Tax=Hyperionvirus sp. TaxID=2487770 RepID=A0A3G5AC95_9VIRU|nr:MAG: hypothetical protein Hyperionvirus45_4 [Hyperionvirus sp.]
MNEYDRELMSLVERADAGDVSAQNSLHNYFFDEDDLLQNFDDPVVMNFYHKGALSKGPYSLYQLAIIYLCHKPHLDKTRGLAFLQESIHANCSQAYFVMAVYHKNKVFADIGDTPEEQAMKYNYFLNLAFEMENSNAYILKAKDTSNIVSKEALLKKAAQLGNVNALSYLGQFYTEKGIYGLAVNVLNEGCDKMNSHAYFNYAILYRDGKGCEKDMQMAMDLFEKSVGLGNVRALVCLGSIWHDRGEYVKAEPYYLEAIAKNDGLACYNMGLIRVADKQYLEALKLFKLGARWGDKSSITKLQRCKLTKNSTDEEIIEKLSTAKTHL